VVYVPTEGRVASAFLTLFTATGPTAPFIGQANGFVAHGGDAGGAALYIGPMRRLSHGFTLIELMVTLAVLALLLAWGVPAFREMLSNNRIAEAANRLVASLHYARTEALRRNRCVRVQASGSPADWNEGWTVAANQSLGCTGTTYQTLRSEPGPGGSLTLSESGGATSLLYRGDGTLESPAAGISIDLCDADRTGETGRRIAVNAAGRPSVSEISCS